MQKLLRKYVKSIFFTDLLILVRGRMCKKKQKTFKPEQPNSQKQQPHRPFLRSRVPVRAWPYVRARTCTMCTTPLMSKNVMSITLTFDFDILAFFGLGDAGLFH